MKFKHILLAAILGFCFTSCYDLTLEPKGVLGEMNCSAANPAQEHFLSGFTMNSR
jgi:hypothetical protein